MNKNALGKKRTRMALWVTLLLVLGLVDNPYNGVTLCSGSLGANPNNDIPASSWMKGC